MSKKKKHFFRSSVNRIDAILNNSNVDLVTSRLIERFKDKFELERYAVYCYETDEVKLYKVMRMHLEVVYVGGADANGYAQGQLHEERTAKIDPINGVISEDSPMGKKLLKAKVGETFTFDTKVSLKFCVLFVPQQRIHN